MSSQSDPRVKWAHAERGFAGSSPGWGPAESRSAHPGRSIRAAWRGSRARRFPRRARCATKGRPSNVRPKGAGPHPRTPGRERAAAGPCHGRRLHLIFCPRCRLAPTCTTSIGRSRTKWNSAVHSPGRVVGVQENDPCFECLRVCTFVRAPRGKPFIVSVSQRCSA